MDAGKKDGTFFFADEGHTLAGLLRNALPLTQNAEGCYRVTACVVTDEMCEKPGLNIIAEDRATVLDAIDRVADCVRVMRNVVPKVK